MRIHTIGDSHCVSGWNKIHKFDIFIHHLGPVLCYSFGQEPLQRCKITEYNILEEDIIIFSLGEIDCRCHIHKYITPILSYKHIIEEIVNTYIKSIVTCVKLLDKKLKYICVFNVLPPVNKKDVCENPAFPFLGDDEERKQYVLYFNKKLKEVCLQTNIIYIDIYDKCTDFNGFLKKEISDGSVHMINSNIIESFINDNFS